MSTRFSETWRTVARSPFVPMLAVVFTKTLSPRVKGNLLYESTGFCNGGAGFFLTCRDDRVRRRSDCFCWRCRARRTSSSFCCSSSKDSSCDDILSMLVLLLDMRVVVKTKDTLLLLLNH